LVIIEPPTKGSNTTYNPFRLKQQIVADLKDVVARVKAKKP